ncbi:glycosyltransferase [Alphaproteobacteria bacterium]|nr:glycosyltransferase [Alphaproteobacteria bacterium]
MATNSITAILPIYREDIAMIGATLTSLNQQSTLPALVVIIDDCPGLRTGRDYDNFHSILSNVPTRIINNDENLGLAKSLNKVLPLIETEFWARTDAGDVNHRSRFNLQHEYMMQHPNCGLLGTQVSDIQRPKTVSSFPTSPKTIRLASKFITPIAHPTYFGRTASLVDISYPDIFYAQDFGFTRYVHKAGVEVHNLSTTLVSYQNTATSDKKYKIRQSACLLIQVLGLESNRCVTKFFSNKMNLESAKMFPLLHFLSLLCVLPKAVGKLISKMDGYL